MKIFLYTDGGSRGNPGPCAYGFVIYDEKQNKIFTEGRYLGENTNNYAEYMALVEGLKKGLELGANEIEIRMDSELIVRQMQGVYKIKQPHLQQLATQVVKFLNRYSNYKFMHIRRELNKVADSLVNEVLDKEALKPPV